MFHSRCIFDFPITDCYQCHEKVTSVRLVPLDIPRIKLPQRSGRWEETEIKFARFLAKQFASGKLPLPDGTHLRAFLSQVLLCDPMRLSKQTYVDDYGIKTYIRADREIWTKHAFQAHMKAQRQYLWLQNRYYGTFIEDRDVFSCVKLHEAQMWSIGFRYFAPQVGQPLTRLPVTVRKVASKNDEQKISDAITFVETMAGIASQWADADASAAGPSAA